MYLELENFFPDSLKNQIEYTFLDDTLPWEFRHATSGNNGVDISDVNILETPQFMHLMNCPERGQVSRTFDLAKSVLFFLEHTTNCKITGVARVKANLLLRDGTAKNKYHPPHIDTGGNSFSMVYYVCNSDGPTVLFDKKAGSNNHLGLTKVAEIQPKKGKAVIFDSNRYHSSSVPTETEYRIVLNFVFSAENLILPK